MKYAMYVEIEAERFLPDEDKIPKGVTSDGMRSPKTDPRSSWVLITKSGTSYIKAGDYVVTQADGSQYIMPADLFEKNYKPLEG